MSEKNVPNIRFKGFTEDWEQRKLGEHAIIKGRLGWKSLKQDEYTKTGPSMIAGKHIQNGIIDWQNVDHIPQWRYDESPEIMLRNNDIIFSKDGSLGNPALIKELKQKATINSTMMLVRLNDIDASFFYQVMVGPSFERLVYLKVSGSSIPHLFQADMTKFVFKTPGIDEQTDIGMLLNKIDALIASNQRKLDQLKEVKKILMQKIFDQEWRFKGFADPWEQRKLESTADEFKSGFNIASEKINNSGKYPVFGGNGIRGYTDSFNHDGEYALIGRQGALSGNMNFSKGKAYFTEHAVAVKANQSNDTKFLLYLMLKMKLARWMTQSAQPGLSVNVIKNISVQLPTKEEQLKIRNLLSFVDQLVASNQRNQNKPR